MKRILSLSLVGVLTVGLVAACDPAVDTTEEVTPLDDTGVMMEESSDDEMLLDETVEMNDEEVYELETTEMEETPEVPEEDDDEMM